MKTNMPLDKIRDTLLEAESAADPPSFLARIIQNKTAPPKPGHSRGVIRDRPRPVREGV